MILEGEQSQAHVGEDEIFSQEVKDLKELQGQSFQFSALRIKRKTKLWDLFIFSPRLTERQTLLLP